MTTVADLAERTRVEYLQGGLPERRNTLSVGITDSDTTVVLNYDAIGIAANSRISIDLEDMHVYAVNPSTKTLTVTRGNYGTTAAAHSADDVVLVGALHSNAAILQAFNDTLYDLESRGMYEIDVAELTYTTATDGYDLTGVTGLLQVINVETRARSRTDWHPLDIGEWRVAQNAETDDFATGNALIMTRQDVAYTGRQLRVWYRKSFTQLSTLAEDAASVSGLESGAEDLLVLGAAVRLASAQPMLRNNLTWQPDPRRADEVPAGATLAAPSNLRRIYERRVQTELSRLDQRYPVRLRVV